MTIDIGPELAGALKDMCFAVIIIIVAIFVLRRQ